MALLSPRYNSERVDLHLRERDTVGTSASPSTSSALATSPDARARIIRASAAHDPLVSWMWDISNSSMNPPSNAPRSDDASTPPAPVAALPYSTTSLAAIHNTYTSMTTASVTSDAHSDRIASDGDGSSLTSALTSTPVAAARSAPKRTIAQPHGIAEKRPRLELVDTAAPSGSRGALFSLKRARSLAAAVRLPDDDAASDDDAPMPPQRLLMKPHFPVARKVGGPAPVAAPRWKKAPEGNPSDVPAVWASEDSSKKLRDVVLAVMGALDISTIAALHRRTRLSVQYSHFNMFMNGARDAPRPGAPMVRGILRWLLSEGVRSGDIASILEGGEATLARLIEPVTPREEDDDVEIIVGEAADAEEPLDEDDDVDWASRAAMRTFRSIVAATGTAQGKTLAFIARLCLTHAGDFATWLETGEPELDFEQVSILLLWLSTAGVEPAELEALFRGGAASVTRMRAHATRVAAPMMNVGPCDVCGCTRAMRRKAFRPRQANEEDEDDAGSVSTRSSSTTVSVSSWDLTDVPDDTTSVGSGTSARVMRPVCRCDACGCGGIAAERDVQLAEEPRLAAIDHILRYDIRVYHALRSSTALVTGCRSYIVSDGATDRDAHSHAPVPVAPGQSHPYLLQRVRSICMLSRNDLIVDVGAGEGFAAIAFAALSGCRAYGVEIVQSRHTHSMQLLRHACPRVAALCKVTPACACVGEGASSATSAPRSSRSSKRAMSTAAVAGSSSAPAVAASSSSAAKLPAFKPSAEVTFSLAGLRYKRAPSGEFVNCAKMSAYVPSLTTARLDRERDMVTLSPADLSRLSSVCERVQLACGDARQVLRAAGSPLLTARVVFCNNYGSKWQVHDFQHQMFRLLSRLMAPGAILVSCSQFSSGTRRGGPALVDTVKQSDENGDSFTHATLYFEVSGGWVGVPHETPGVASGDDDTDAVRDRSAPSDTGMLVPWRLLMTAKHDAACEEVWRRGMHMPQYAALRAIVEGRAAARATAAADAGDVASRRSRHR